MALDRGKKPLPTIKNAPRIGKGYSLTREFKPSKKLEKQFPQAAKKRERVLAEPVFQKKLQDLVSAFPAPYQLAETFEQRLKALEGFKPQKVDLPRGDLYDEIAVLANIAGGIDEAADILDVDVEWLVNLFLGGNLNRMQERELEGQYRDFARDVNAHELFDIDIDYVEQEAAIVKETRRLIDDVESGDILRQAIAESNLTLEKLNKGFTLFDNLTRSQTGKILDAWVEQQGLYYDFGIEPTFSLDDMFDVYGDDNNNFWDMEESEFWAWFRELFYS